MDAPVQFPLAQAASRPSAELQEMKQNRCEQPAGWKSQESYQCQSVTNNSEYPVDRRIRQGAAISSGKVMTSDNKQGSLSEELEFLTGEQGFLTGEQWFMTGKQGFLTENVDF